MALELVLPTGSLGFIPTIDDNQDIERDDSDSEEEVSLTCVKTNKLHRT